MPKMSSMRFALIAAVMVAAAACHKTPKVEPVPTVEVAPPPAPAPRPAPPPRLSDEPVPVPPEPVESVSSTSLDDLNRNSPLKPAFFVLDSSEIDPTAKSVLDGNAALLRQNATWIVTIEGHCDERGTAEYRSGTGRTTCRCGARLPGVAGHSRQPPEDGELREGIPVRSRPR